jgi:CRP-like cAMP-binding protein
MIEPPKPGPQGGQYTLLDRALAMAVEGERELALADLGSILETDPSRSAALLLVGRLLGEDGQFQVAESALSSAAGFAEHQGALPRALAALCQMREFGMEAHAVALRLAQLFGRNSARLTKSPPRPPTLNPRRPGIHPLPESRPSSQLCTQLTALVQRSADQLALVGDFSRLPPQPLFSSLSSEQLTVFFKIFRLVCVGTGATIVSQGEPGDAAYVMARGEVAVLRSDSTGGEIVLARLGSGALFGEMALLSRAPRAAHVVTTRPSMVLEAPRDALDALVAGEPEIGAVLAEFCRQRMIQNLVSQSPVLAGVHSSERAQLVERFVSRSFEKGDSLIVQGNDSDGLHLIASGEVRVIHHDGEDGIVIATLGPGEVVGEISLVLRRTSNAHVVATQPTVTMHLPREDFLAMVRAEPSVLTHLYQLAIERDQMVTTVVAQPAESADDLILL